MLRESASACYGDFMPLSTAQAAQRTGIPLRTIQWAIKHGKLPAQRFGDKMWMIDPTDLDQWAAAHKS